MNRRTTLLLALILTCADALARGRVKTQAVPQATLDQYVAEATRDRAGPGAGSSGSLWTSQARLTELAADLRARSVNDVVTILVTDRATAISSGSTKTKRASSVNASVASIAGPTRAKGPLAELAKASGQSQLDGEGSTNRETSFTTSLAARVTQVLPNGFLLVEGSKQIYINSETQLITLRGVVRPVDLSSGNTVRSDRVAQMELRINGKGVVGDAVRRPFILYRLLMGILPF